MHDATRQILRFFDYQHLAEPLCDVSQPFHDLAHRMADELEGPELTAGLRKLLEAKDCMVRAALPRERQQEPQDGGCGQPVEPGDRFKSIH